MTPFEAEVLALARELLKTPLTDDEIALLELEDEEIEAEQA